jgi:hypothetical protein
MSFMEREITDFRTWYKGESSDCSTCFVAADDFTIEQFKSDVLEDSSADVETVSGFGCRLSAPGYLDCTEWSVFDSVSECESYLDEYYPEDDDSDDEETTSHVKCDQCEMVSINGVACHEIGCPNSKKTWNESAQTWLKVRECFNCGFEVYGDEPCSCQDFDSEEI